MNRFEKLHERHSYGSLLSTQQHVPIISSQFCYDFAINDFAISVRSLRSFAAKSVRFTERAGVRGKGASNCTVTA
jgi:hypothetical protein